MIDFEKSGILSEESIKRLKQMENNITSHDVPLERREQFMDIEEYHEGLDRLLKSLTEQKKTRLVNIKER